MFRSTWTPPPRQRDLPPPPAAEVRPLVRGVYGDCGTMAAQPKGEKARPGKRAPTAAEREWMNWIVAFGCVACRKDGYLPRPTAVHHLLRGGQRIGHLHAIGLCDPGHHQGGQPLGLISRHPWKTRFETQYGTEAELLAWLRAENGKEPSALAVRTLVAMESGAKA